MDTWHLQRLASAVNQGYLTQLLDDLKTINDGPPPGMTRLGYTETENRSHDYVARHLRELGCDIEVDAAGNLVGYLPATNGPDAAGAKAILVGSHLDSVPNGGYYDGPVGVVIGIELVRLLREHLPDRPYRLGVVVWRCEESSRFQVSTAGSRAAVGTLTLQEAEKAVDAGGISLAEAMHRLGFDPTALGRPTMDWRQIHSFWEVHIEQGPVLENLCIPVGIVTGIKNITRLRVSVRGQTLHSGGTPMSLRRDALAGAAEMTLALESIVRIHGGPHSVGHIGVLRSEPGRANTIAGYAELLADIRDLDAGLKQRIANLFVEAVQHIAAKRRLEVTVDWIRNGQPHLIDAGMVDLLSDTANLLGIATHRLPSGGSHDALEIAGRVPSAMLFVPSPGGVSHHHTETVNMADIVQATRVLAAAIARIMTGDAGTIV